MRTVLIHAGLSHGEQWKALRGELPIGNFVSVELPGHGRAPPWDAARDYGDQAAELAAGALAGGPVALVGHSFGGVLALRLALEHPRAVARAILIEPVFFAAARGTPEHAAHTEASAPFRAAIAAGDTVAATRAFLSRWGAGPGLDEMPPSRRDYMIARVPLIAATEPMIEEDRAGLLAPGRLEGLDLPVRIVCGDRSPEIIDRIAQCLAARLPRARIEWVAGAGHMLPMTHPAELAAILRDASAA